MNSVILYLFIVILVYQIIEKGNKIIYKNIIFGYVQSLLEFYQYSGEKVGKLVYVESTCVLWTGACTRTVIELPRTARGGHVVVPADPKGCWEHRQYSRGRARAMRAPKQKYMP